MHFIGGCCTIMMYVAPSLVNSHICYSSVCTCVYIPSPLSTSWWISWFSNLQAGCSPGMLFMLYMLFTLSHTWYGITCLCYTCCVPSAIPDMVLCVSNKDWTFVLCSLYVISRKTISWPGLADTWVYSCACLEWISNLEFKFVLMVCYVFRSRDSIIVSKQKL